MNFFRQFKAGFWKILRFLGKVQATILLALFYLIGMGIARLYLLITFKDPLEKRKSKTDSYWKSRRGVPEPESFKRQF